MRLIFVDSQTQEKVDSSEDEVTIPALGEEVFIEGVIAQVTRVIWGFEDREVFVFVQMPQGVEQPDVEEAVTKAVGG